MLSASLVSDNLTSYGRRHFKLFTNCHVSWDTLYIKKNIYEILDQSKVGLQGIVVNRTSHSKNVRLLEIMLIQSL